MPPGPDNPKGFSENLALIELHDKFLKAISSKWDDPRPIGEQHFQGAAARRFQAQLRSLLLDEFGQGRPLIKDPRICRLMPLWTPLIKEHFPQANFILPIRHPVEVAQSLLKRGRLAMGQCLQLWAVHVLEGERTTRAFSRTFTTYDQLMRFPTETILPVAERLSLSIDAVPAAISRQIDSNMRHHSDLSWPAGAPHEGLTLSIYKALISESAGKEEILNQLRRDYYGPMGWPC
jgi:hypothetical protein